MREIDIASWRRREHFEFFRRVDVPFYNVNARVDVTGLRDGARERGVPFTTLLMHLVMRSLNGIENFRWRIRGDAVVEHEVLHATFAYLEDGDDLFRWITVEYRDDVVAFDEAVRAGIAASTSYFDLETLTGRDDFAFLSPIPWISFTGIDHTFSLNKDDAIPRVTWGKYFDHGGKTLLPLNIQANHVFVDGVHMARFFEAMDGGARAVPGGG